MIFKKGELVKTNTIKDESLSRFSNCIGRIVKVKNLEENSTPFVVEFFFESARYEVEFSGSELQLVDNKTKFDEEVRNHKVQDSLYKLSKKD